MNIITELFRRSCLFEGSDEVFEEGMLCVLLGEDGTVSGDVPIDAEGGIEDADATFCLRMIELVAFVLEYRCVAEDGKTVSHSFRNKELTMVILCQFYSDVLTIGRAALADVYDDIEDGTLDAADEFALGKRRALEVQATHDTVGTHAFIVLNKVYFMSKDRSYLFIKLSLRETLKEISSVITKYLRLDDEDSVYICFYYFHIFLYLKKGSSKSKNLNYLRE